MAELSLEHFGDHSLICCPDIFETEGHDLVAKDPLGVMNDVFSWSASCMAIWW